MNTVKTKVLVSAILSIVLCVSLIAGATFALFTSESNVNIAVTSGKVDVVASVDETSVQTKQLDKDYVDGIENTYGGGIVVADGNITIPNIVPGDGVKFNIVVENNSTIAVKYRTVLTCDDTGLLAALKITIGDTSATYTGRTEVSKWQILEVRQNLATVPVSIELEDKGEDNNAYQGKSVTISYAIEAVQGNAETEDAPEGTIYIHNAADLAALKDIVVSKEWTDSNSVKTIEFLNDINMADVNYVTPINDFNAKELRVGSGLVVKGNDHYISGLNQPLFDLMNAKVEISNLTIKDSKIERQGSYLGLGAFIGGAQWCNVTMTNCHANNVTVEGGDTRAAALVGYVSGSATITNCSVNNCVVKADGSVAGIVGHEVKCDYNDWSGVTVENCTVSNSTFTATDKDWRVGSVVGTVQTGVTVNNCTLKDNTLVMNDSKNVGQTIANPGHELFGRIVGGKLVIDGGQYIANGVSLSDEGVYLISSAEGLFWFNDQINNKHNSFGGSVIKLTSDIDMGGAIWVPAGQDFTLDYANLGYADTVQFCGTFDGQKHSISNIKIGLTKEQIKSLDLYNSGSTSDQEYYSAGFIGTAVGGVVKNLTIKDSSVFGDHNVGAIVGNAEMASIIENCHVVKVNVEGVHISEDQCGDKVGGVVGSLNGTISGCTATDCKIFGGRDVGQVVGCAQMNAKVTDCSATGVSVVQDDDCHRAGENVKEEVVGRNVADEE